MRVIARINHGFVDAWQLVACIRLGVPCVIYPVALQVLAQEASGFWGETLARVSGSWEGGRCLIDKAILDSYSQPCER
jgi:hypothetical protein